MAIRSITQNDRNFAISYKILDNKQSSWILFLHGWGANKELMEMAFGKLFSDFNHLYVDLCGFGGSSNDYILDSKDYAKIMQIFLESLKILPKIIIAHSFGGKVATLLNPPLLVLLSSAGLQKKQNLKVKLKIKLARIARFFHLKARFLVSQDAQNLSQNMYETFKIVVREDFSEIFQKLRAKTIIFWGKDDDALPLYLGEKMQSLIKDARFYAMNGNHFFFLENAVKIEEITLKAGNLNGYIRK